MRSLLFTLSFSLLIGYLFSSFSYRENIQEKAITFIQDTCIGQKVSGNMQGFWKCWYDNRYSEMTYLDNYLHGIKLTYYHSDKKFLYLSESFVNGKKEGASTSYFMDGSPKTITTYENDYRVFRVHLDSLGNIITQGGYVLDSIEVESTTFDSKTLEIAQVKKVKRLQAVNDGTWSFYENGMLKKEYFYDHGVLLDSVVIK